jgi:hypothetical protein
LVSVKTAVERLIAENDPTEIEAELARALASQIDKGEGTASAVKELRTLVGAIEDRKPEADAVDELSKARAARLAQ